MHQSESNAFWNYSLTVWENEALRARLLALQTQEGIDINLFLFGCWSTTLQLDIASAAGQALAISAYWQENFIRPLRALRTYANAEQLLEIKASLLDTELVTEQAEQQALFTLIEHGCRDPKTSPRELFKQNLQSLGFNDLAKQLDTQILACLGCA